MEATNNLKYTIVGKNQNILQLVLLPKQQFCVKKSLISFQSAKSIKKADYFDANIMIKRPRQAYDMQRMFHAI